MTSDNTSVPLWVALLRMARPVHGARANAADALAAARRDRADRVQAAGRSGPPTRPGGPDGQLLGAR